VGRWVAERYVWPEAGAVRFVLTGVPPIAEPVRVRVGPSGREGYPRPVIALEVEPWVGVKTVEEIYRRLQRRLLGGINQRPSEKNLAVVEFVTDHTLPWQDAPSFRSLARAWNEHAERLGRPDWAYKNLDMFSRDYNRTLKALLAPDYPSSLVDAGPSAEIRQPDPR
jgi:hypothetical protein